MLHANGIDHLLKVNSCFDFTINYFIPNIDTTEQARAIPIAEPNESDFKRTPLFMGKELYNRLTYK